MVIFEKEHIMMSYREKKKPQSIQKSVGNKVWETKKYITELKQFWERQRIMGKNEKLWERGIAGEMTSRSHKKLWNKQNCAKNTGSQTIRVNYGENRNYDTKNYRRRHRIGGRWGL